MSFEINETASLLIQRSLATATKNAQASMVKLSYGKQMSAVEDAASMMIAEGMESKRRGATQAIENAQTGMNMLSTAEAGLSNVSDNLQRMRELAIQRENGTYSEEDKAAIDSEISALKGEIDRVSKSTSFNDINLLDGSASDVKLQVGPDADPNTNVVDIGGVLGSVKPEDLGIGDISAPDFLDNIDNAITQVSSMRSDIGATTNRLESAVTNLFVQNENISAAQSRIIDTDVASEVSRLTRNNILQNSSANLLAQANQSASIASVLL